MKTLKWLVYRKQWQAAQATIDALLASGLLANDAKTAGLTLTGEHLSGRLGAGSMERSALVETVMAHLRREPLGLPYTPEAEPLRVLVGPDDQRPHSRACGWRNHPHGPDCSRDCPTCGLLAPLGTPTSPA